MKKALAVVDKYNNFLKHNGLQSLTRRTADGGIQLEVPQQIPMHVAGWNAQQPDSDLDTFAPVYMLDAAKAFSEYFSCLAASVPDLLARQLLVRVSAPKGIQDFWVGAAPMSGVLDGYQPALGTSGLLSGTKHKP